MWERIAGGLACGSGSNIDAMTKGRENHGIKMLDVSDNEIREAGARAVAAMVVLGERLSQVVQLFWGFGWVCFGFCLS